MLCQVLLGIYENSPTKKTKKERSTQNDNQVHEAILNGAQKISKQHTKAD